MKRPSKGASKHRGTGASRVRVTERRSSRALERQGDRNAERYTVKRPSGVALEPAGVNVMSPRSGEAVGGSAPEGFVVVRVPTRALDLNLNYFEVHVVKYHCHCVHSFIAHRLSSLSLTFFSASCSVRGPNIILTQNDVLLDRRVDCSRTVYVHP